MSLGSLLPQVGLPGRNGSRLPGWPFGVMLEACVSHIIPLQTDIKEPFAFGWQGGKGPTLQVDDMASILVQAPTFTC